MSMTIERRVLVAAGMSWAFSVSLGLILAVRLYRNSLGTVFLSPGIILLTIAVCTLISLMVTPLATWAMRFGARKLRIYGPVLWIVLALTALAVPQPFYGFCSVVTLSVIALVMMGLFPTRSNRPQV